MNKEKAKEIQLAYRRAFADVLIADIKCDEYLKKAMMGIGRNTASISQKEFDKLLDRDEMVVLRKDYLAKVDNLTKEEGNIIDLYVEMESDPSITRETIENSKPFVALSLIAKTVAMDMDKVPQEVWK